MLPVALIITQLGHRPTAQCKVAHEKIPVHCWKRKCYFFFLTRCIFLKKYFKAEMHSLSTVIPFQQMQESCRTINSFLNLPLVIYLCPLCWVPDDEDAVTFLRIQPYQLQTLFLKLSFYAVTKRNCHPSLPSLCCKTNPRAAIDNFYAY